jgi:saccharopine dehydrogenase-like NADP-dependent oxidoreductase
MADIVALGCGLVGEYVITKLIKEGHNLTVVGLEIPKKLLGKCSTIVMDALEFVNKIQGKPLIINMLPGSIGNTVRKNLLEKKLNVVDLAFTIEDPRIYNSLAIKNNCTLVYDTGIAPGFSNLLVAKAINLLETIDECKIRVGGIPAKPDQNWSYMAPFSPTDVIEEYERPARILQNYETVEFSALHELHTINYTNLTDGEVGILQAFMTDGLRSLLDLKSCKNMSEYTLRWPGHIEKFIELQKKGMLKNEKRTKTISDLVDSWKFDSKINEFTLLDVNISSENGEKRWIVYDKGTKDASSMARTTGLVTLGFVDEMLNKTIPTGVFAPEELHKIEGLTQRITQKLKDENIKIMELF